jgi:hypothetical protein
MVALVVVVQVVVAVVVVVDVQLVVVVVVVWSLKEQLGRRLPAFFVLVAVGVGNSEECFRRSRGRDAHLNRKEKYLFNVITEMYVVLSET